MKRGYYSSFFGILRTRPPSNRPPAFDSDELENAVLIFELSETLFLSLELSETFENEILSLRIDQNYCQNLF